MPNINIKLYAGLKNAFKKDSIQMEASSVNSIITFLKLKNKKASKLLAKNAYFIVIDGRVIKNQKTKKLKENDTLHVFPMIAGG